MVYELPQELPNNLKTEENLGKSRNECTHILVPNLPSRNKNLTIENSIKSAIKLFMKDEIHFSNLFISLKVFCEGLKDPQLISKLTKKLFMTMIRCAFSKTDSENSLLGKLLMDCTSFIALSTSNIIVRDLNVSNCSTRTGRNLSLPLGISY